MNDATRALVKAIHWLSGWRATVEQADADDLDGPMINGSDIAIKTILAGATS